MGNNNLSLGVVQGVDDELVSLLELEFVEGSESLVADSNTGSRLGRIRIHGSAKRVESIPFFIL